MFNYGSKLSLKSIFVKNLLFGLVYIIIIWYSTGKSSPALQRFCDGNYSDVKVLGKGPKIKKRESMGFDNTLQTFPKLNYGLFYLK